MSERILAEALLIAARRHRLIDRAMEERLRTALGTVTVTTPTELDACLVNSAALIGEPLSCRQHIVPFLPARSRDVESAYRHLDFLKP